MTDFKFEVANPWFLLLLIPALVLGIIPFFRLHKKRRRASKHIIPFIIHMVLVFLLATTLSGMRIVRTLPIPTDSEVVFVVDVSDSNKMMVDDMNRYVETIVKESRKPEQEGTVSFGYVPFANGVFEKEVVKIGSFATGNNVSNLIKIDKNAEASETNIATALEYASTLFSSKNVNKRIIVLSDGRETISACYNTAQALADTGIVLDAAHFDIASGKTAEVQIRDLTTNGKVEPGKNVVVRGSIRSTINATVVVEFYEDGEYIGRTTKEVRGGSNADTPFSYEYLPEEPGLHTVTAKLKINGDTIEQNNMLCSWYTVEDIASILVVYGTSDQKNQITNVVGSLTEYRVTIIDAEEEGGYASFPATMEELLEYDEIVLMNVDFTKLPTGAEDLIKRYVEENGRGLVVTLGDECNNIYNHPELADKNKKDDENVTIEVTSPIEQILPVELKVQNEEQSVAFIFIVDLSSSMREKIGNQTRYDVALASIKHAIDALDVEKDYVGVIMFDETTQVAVPMTKIRDEENLQLIKENIEYEFEHYYYEHYLDENGNETEIRVNKNHKQSALEGNIYLKPKSEGGWGYQLRSGVRWGTYDYTTGDVIKAHGTKYLPPILQADEMFSTAVNEDGHKLDVKQIIFISDGEPNDRSQDANVKSPYIGVVEQMTNAGIVTSAIGIGMGTNENTATKEIRYIAEAGYTEPKFLETPDQVQGELFKIVEQSQGDDENKDSNFLVKLYTDTKVLKGANGSFDILKGYYGTTIKENATMVLYADDLRPIIAEWQYGLGKVTVFTSDLGRNWTQAMFDNGDGINNRAIIRNILVNSLNDEVDSTGIEIDGKPKRKWGEGTTSFVVELPVALRDSENVKVIFTDAQGEEYVANLMTSSEIEKAKEDGRSYVQRISQKRYLVNLITPDETENGTYTIKVMIVDNKTMANADVVYDQIQTAVVGEYKDEYDVFGNMAQGKSTINDIVKNANREPIVIDKDGNGVTDMFKKDEDMVMKPEIRDLDDEFAIAALILFVTSIICRNFLFQKEKKRKVMTDEEQIASMRNSGR